MNYFKIRYRRSIDKMCTDIYICIMVNCLKLPQRYLILIPANVEEYIHFYLSLHHFPSTFSRSTITRKLFWPETIWGIQTRCSKDNCKKVTVICHRKSKIGPIKTVHWYICYLVHGMLGCCVYVLT